MTVDCIHYQSGYKYQLKAELVVQTAIHPEAEASIGRFVELGVDGMLEIASGYAWDGPSGPTADTKNFMRGSLVHDALYQLMREEQLDKARWRRSADKELVRICREDGMNRIRAWWVLNAVRWFADGAASPGSVRPLEAAPKECVDRREGDGTTHSS